MTASFHGAAAPGLAGALRDQPYGPGWLGERLPPVLLELRVLEVQAWQWLGLFVALLISVLVATALGALGHALALRAARSRNAWDERLVHDAGGPARLLVGTGTFAIFEHALQLSPPAHAVVAHLLRIAMVLVFSWAALRGFRFVGDLIVARTTRSGSDESSARARITRVMVLRRIAGFAVVVIAGAVVLMQFDALRTLGASLLASAGLAGIVVGLAAQRSLASVFAGIQISLTEPIRVGDVVALEKDAGTIEEITLTYVVVRVWDGHRIIVPITRFLDSPFQSWAQTGIPTASSVSVHADYGAPVADLRRELERFVATRPEWDGRVASLTVSDATERTIQLTAVVSSADSGRNGALQSAVREHLVRVLSDLDGGRYLPHARFVKPPVEE